MNLNQALNLWRIKKVLFIKYFLIFWDHIFDFSMGKILHCIKRNSYHVQLNFMMKTAQDIESHGVTQKRRLWLHENLNGGAKAVHRWTWVQDPPRQPVLGGSIDASHTPTERFEEEARRQVRDGRVCKNKLSHTKHNTTKANALEVTYLQGVTSAAAPHK